MFTVRKVRKIEFEHFP